jgi:hypothetical protein
MQLHFRRNLFLIRIRTHVDRPAMFIRTAVNQMCTRVERVDQCLGGILYSEISVEDFLNLNNPARIPDRYSVLFKDAWGTAAGRTALSATAQALEFRIMLRHH